MLNQNHGTGTLQMQPDVLFKDIKEANTYSHLEISWANQEEIRGLWSSCRQAMVLKLK